MRRSSPVHARIHTRPKQLAEVCIMPKFLSEASHSTQGIHGLLEDRGARRREAIEMLVNGMRGSLEAFYYAFGDRDLYVIADLPDDAAATAASLVVGASGAGSVKTTVLITPETVDHRPPGTWATAN